MRALVSYIVRVGFLCRKELLVLLADPQSRAMMFLPALLQSLLFGYGATYDLTNAPYAVLDLSRGAASTALLARVDGTGVFNRVATLRSAAEIADVIDRGDALLVLSIPGDFEARLAAGQSAPLQMILDGRNSTTAGAAAGLRRRDRCRVQPDPGRRAADRRRASGVVQPEPRIAVEPHAGADWRPQHAPDVAPVRVVGRAGT